VLKKKTIKKWYMLKKSYLNWQIWTLLATDISWLD
jgi:hypothetical protein